MFYKIGFLDFNFKMLPQEKDSSYFKKVYSDRK